MKKEIMANLLVGSATANAGLAPLSVQVVTTGNASAQVEFDGGILPDAGGDPNTVGPGPDATNSSFDLIFTPRKYDFDKLSIPDDSTKLIPNKNDAGRNGHTKATGIGDLRGTKEGWHVTAQSDDMKLGDESLGGDVTIGVNGLYTLRHGEGTNQYTNQGATIDMEARPEGIDPNLWNPPLAGNAVLVADTTSGKRQGMWGLSMFDTTSSITTSTYNIKAGAYTGNITWNLVAGPLI